MKKNYYQKAVVFFGILTLWSALELLAMLEQREFSLYWWLLGFANDSRSELAFTVNHAVQVFVGALAFLVGFWFVWLCVYGAKYLSICRASAQNSALRSHLAPQNKFLRYAEIFLAALTVIAFACAYAFIYAISLIE